MYFTGYFKNFPSEVNNYDVNRANFCHIDAQNKQKVE